MSIIRISVLNDGIYAPDPVGNIDARAFSTRRGAGGRGQGKMGLFERGERPRPTDPFWAYLRRSCAIEAAKLPADAPVTVMVHGFMFDPAMVVVSPPHHHKADNPHARLYHFEEHPLARETRDHSTSWPRRLGFAEGDEGAAGLCIGFGWYSNPGFFSSLVQNGTNHYVQAYRNAEGAAWQLLCLLEVLSEVLDRPIDLFCHSLGSRVVIRALAMAASPLPNLAARESLPPGRQVVTPVLGRPGRVLLLAGAEKVLEAQLMMSYLRSWAAAGQGRTLPAFYNIVSRENDVLDVFAENFGPAAAGSKQVVGHNGLERRDPSWIDIQLDDPGVVAWFRERDYSISGDDTSSIWAVLDHWIHFTWRGNMRVYHDVLRNRDDWDIARMKADQPALFDRVRLNRGPGARGYD